MISLDAELAWGFHDLDEPPASRVENARYAWGRLVELFDTYAVPATWAVVGHLMLDGRDDHRQRQLAMADGGLSRGFDEEETPTEWWYGDGLVEAIEDASVDHEIASHSFSHPIFEPDRLSRDAASAELESSVNVARERDFDLTSFVFPRNVVGYRDLLAEHGFTAYRGTRPPKWHDGTPVYAAGKLASALARTSPPIVSPEVDEHGLVDVPASFYLFSLGNGDWPFVKPVCNDLLAGRARRGIDEAIDSNGVFHLWLHPNNLLYQADFDLLEEVLVYVADRRERTDLTVETMEAVARRVRDDRQVVDVEREETERSVVHEYP
ncbi:polysaccharide deacetylase family protein [Natrialbaceae archaeon A-gly3]